MTRSGASAAAREQADAHWLDVFDLVHRLERELRIMFAHALVVECSVAEMIESGDGQRGGLVTSLQASDLLCQSLDGLAEFCSDILEANRGGKLGEVDLARPLSRLRLQAQADRLAGRMPSESASDEDELWEE